MKNGLTIFKTLLIILLANFTSFTQSTIHLIYLGKDKLFFQLAALAFALGLAGRFLVYAQAPSAGTTIGNQSSATFRDGSGTDRNVTSNLVETIIQQVASLTLSINGFRTPTPGTEVIYPHVLTNTGNGTDDFTLTLFNVSRVDDFDMTNIAIYADANQDSLPDDFTDLNGTTVTVGEGESFYMVVGTTPGTTIDNQRSDLTLIATSVFDGAQNASNTDTTTITSQAVINTTKAIDLSRGLAGSGPYTFTLTYTNTGINTAAGVMLTDTIPTGMTYVANSGRWSVTGATVLTDANNRDTQGTMPDIITYDFGVTTANTLTAVIGQITPGASGTLTFQVNVDASATPGIINNTGQVSYDDGSRTIIGPVPTNTVPFTVDPSLGVVISDNGSTTDDDGSVNDIVTETAAPQTGAVNFENVVDNTSNATDTFNITLSGSTFPAGTTFQFQSDGTTPLVDSNSDSIPDTGPIAAGGSDRVVVRANVPPHTIGGGPYDVIVTATSIQDVSVTDTATNRLGTITANTVDLTNDLSVAGGAVAGDG